MFGARPCPCWASRLSRSHRILATPNPSCLGGVHRPCRGGLPAWTGGKWRSAFRDFATGIRATPSLAIVPVDTLTIRKSFDRPIEPMSDERPFVGVANAEGASGFRTQIHCSGALADNERRANVGGLAATCPA